MLLEIDGLHKNWQHGVTSDYSGELGLHCPGDYRRFQRIFDRLHHGNADDRAYDSTRRVSKPFFSAPPSHDSGGISHHPATASYTYLQSMSFSACRRAFIDHFDYMYRHHAVVWPSRTGTDENLHNPSRTRA
jgi:hypothetical protein